MLQKKLHEAFQVQTFARSVDRSLQIFKCCHFFTENTKTSDRIHKMWLYKLTEWLSTVFTVFRRLKHSNKTLHVLFFSQQNSIMFPISPLTPRLVFKVQRAKKKKDFDNAESELNKINSHSELSVRSDLTYVILFCWACWDCRSVCRPSWTISWAVCRIWSPCR